MMILVTGSAGHLGEALMRLLRARGEAARGIDLKPSPFTDAVGSIVDRSFVAAAMAGVRAVIHAATLHKPHVGSHPAQAFVDTNVSGTLALVEAAQAAGVGAFVFTSTTSAFGSALSPPPGAPAAWITEAVAPVPRNVYGTTKLAAESLVELAHRRDGLPAVILRTARFFPEGDDDPETRERYGRDNVQANELLYRRADIADVAEAHLLAVARAPALGFGRFIVSATTPFEPEDLPELRRDAAAVVAQRFPQAAAVYAPRGWALFPTIDRVYVNAAARAALGWRPAYDFGRALADLAEGHDFRSDLARQVGAKGYHAAGVDPGPYAAV
jgi:UDP-glucose 4-epimerase